jgi:hypothetical protein
MGGQNNKAVSYLKRNCTVKSPPPPLERLKIVPWSEHPYPEYYISMYKPFTHFEE